MNIQENIDRIKEVMKITPTYAVIEILLPLAYMDEKYRYQMVPYHATQEDKIYIKKGSSGYKTISTKNIEILGSGDKEEMSEFLRNIRYGE